jgi:hypothetical protein
MEETIKGLDDLSVEELEEIFFDVTRNLEGAAYEAYVEGNRHFAMISKNMSEAIRLNADELARDDTGNARRVLHQATAVIARFTAAHPIR